MLRYPRCDFVYLSHLPNEEKKTKGRLSICSLVHDQHGVSNNHIRTRQMERGMTKSSAPASPWLAQLSRTRVLVNYTSCRLCTAVSRRGLLKCTWYIPIAMFAREGRLQEPHQLLLEGEVVPACRGRGGGANTAPRQRHVSSLLGRWVHIFFENNCARCVATAQTSVNVKGMFNTQRRLRIKGLARELLTAYCYSATLSQEYVPLVVPCLRIGWQPGWTAEQNRRLYPPISVLVRQKQYGGR